MVGRFLSYVVGLARRRRIGREADEELRFHIEQETNANIRRGMTPEEARRTALRDLGGLAQTAEAVLDVRTIWLDAVWRDIRYAVRALRRTPAFTAAALATLALVIGANSAVFSLADTILWRPLPYPQPERLARVVWMTQTSNVEETATSVTGRTWEAIRNDARTVDVALTAGGLVASQRVNFNADGVAAFVMQARVGAGYFRVLGVMPFIGREFTPDEDRAGGARVAVLGYDLWERMFQSDPAVIGRSMRLRGEAYEVIGVMPKDFANPKAPVDIFTPVRPTQSGEGGGANYQIVARLRDGRQWAEAEGELSNIGQALLTTSPQTAGTIRRLTVRPLQETLNYGVDRPIYLLVGAAMMVLLIACVNLAALLLARGASRRKELATRIALGSGRAAIVQQLVIENLLIAVGGSMIGLAVGYVCLDTLQALGGDLFTDWSRVRLDGRAIAITGTVSILTALLFGVSPALVTSRIDLNGALTEDGSRAVAGSARHWGRRVLIGAEVALSVVLLVVGGLFVRTLVNLNSLSPGFDPSHVTATSVSLQDARYRSADAVTKLFEASLTEIRRTPGVESAAVSLDLPYGRLLNYPVRFTERPAPDPVLPANFMYVTPAFFDTLRIPLRLGRVFTSEDRAGQPAVVVVNEAFVRFLAPGTNPLDRQLRLDSNDWQIVGVVGNVQTRNSGLPVPGMARGPIEAPPIVFLPAAQVSDAFVRLVHQWFEPYWTVRTSERVNAEVVLRRAINNADPLLPVAPATSLAAVRAEAMSFQRLLMTLIGTFAGAALLLATVGIYGLIAQTILDRTREFGIRLALGATFGGTIRRVMWAGVVIAAVGTAIGSGLAWMATRLVAGFLWDVDAHDPLTFGAVVALLFIAAVVSSALPALRILRLDPAQILRA